MEFCYFAVWFQFQRQWKRRRRQQRQLLLTLASSVYGQSSIDGRRRRRLGRRSRLSTLPFNS